MLFLLFYCNKYDIIDMNIYGDGLTSLYHYSTAVISRSPKWKLKKKKKKKKKKGKVE